MCDGRGLDASGLFGGYGSDGVSTGGVAMAGEGSDIRVCSTSFSGVGFEGWCGSSVTCV